MKGIALILMVAFATLAHATPVKLLLPTWGAATTDSTFPPNSGANDPMVCATIAAPFSRGNFTKLGIYISSSAPADTLGAAIYPDDDAGAPIATLSQPGGPAAVITQSGLTPFALVGGTLYRTCVCSTNGGSFGSAYLGIAHTIGDYDLTKLIQAFHPEYMGIAANPCVVGVPPSTTGAIAPDTTTNTHRQIPVILVQE